ncbi:MAG: caspase family protein [Myxococcales bacterium]|nr:caspase family protein [Myxococcales bacterium]
MSVKHLILLAFLAILPGCYKRVNLPTKSTPATTRMFVDFKIERSLAESISAQLQEAMKTVGGTGATVDVGARMTASMRAELVQRNIALPIMDPSLPAELALTGQFRQGTAGIDLEWQLIHTQSGALVLAGVYSDMFFTGNVEPFVDDVLGKMLRVDIDQYGNGGSAIAARPIETGGGLPSPPGAHNDGSKSYAVVIGIEKYREKLPDATHAEADARAFAAYAQKTLGVPEAHIRVITGERAGRADMASMIEEWLPRNATQPGGKVYVFFSGHGAPDPESGDAYLVPYDADPAYIKTRGFSVRDLYASLEKLPGQQAMVFLDACFSGSGDRSVIAQGTRPLVPVKAPQSQGGIIALTAAAARETTGAARDAANGLFTRHLLAGLAGAADANGDHDVTLAELADHVRQKVSSDARLDNREQTPSLLVARGINPDVFRVVQGLAQ